MQFNQNNTQPKEKMHAIYHMTKYKIKKPKEKMHAIYQMIPCTGENCARAKHRQFVWEVDESKGKQPGSLMREKGGVEKNEK